MKLKIALTLLVVGIPVAAWASPATTICLAESWVDHQTSAFEPLMDDAKERVEKILWKPTAKPKVLILDGETVFGLFSYNQYGSAISLPHKTCVLMGPKGMNVDVLAHELVHAEIADMLGYWKYYWLPRWLDEGVAMQVDYRERYDPHVLNGDDPHYVTSKTGSEFFKGPTKQVIRNYAAAKLLMKSWLASASVDELREHLEQDPTKIIDSLSR